MEIYKGHEINTCPLMVFIYSIVLLIDLHVVKYVCVYPRHGDM